jgi:hypothetical protein
MPFFLTYAGLFRNLPTRQFPTPRLCEQVIEAVLPVDYYALLNEYDESQTEAREDAIARNLLKVEGDALVILGGAHDLTDNLERLKGDAEVEYVRVQWWNHSKHYWEMP